MKLRNAIFLFIFSLTFLSGQVGQVREGFLSGILSSKGKAWIEVKGDEGYLHRYLAPWIGDGPGSGGGFDPSLLMRFDQLVVGNRVRLQWFWDGHLRVREIAKEIPETKEGIFVGYVLEVGEKFVDVQNKREGKPWRFYLPWKGGFPQNGGGYDKDVLLGLKEHQPTNPLRFEWSYDIRPRINRILTREEIEFRPFYDLDEVPPWLGPRDSTFEIKKPPKRNIINPFDNVKPDNNQNPFDSVAPPSNPFDSVAPPANPFDSVTPTTNPFDQVGGDNKTPPEGKGQSPNPFDAVQPKPKTVNPFENVPLPQEK
ncbi:MAG: hypothetical protein VX130_08475 [Verrucomicrobiota bacterium]|nr:hypothetical protein [Verrucomicrobiota bacterium]